MVRKEAVGEWLQSVVKETVEQEISEIDTDDKIILSLLTGIYIRMILFKWGFSNALTRFTYINSLIINLLIIIILMSKSTKIGRSMSNR